MQGHARRTTAIGLVVAFLTGLIFALQIYLTSQLATHLGSPILAGSINNLLGLGVLLVLSTARRVPQRALAHLREHGMRVRWWWPLVGISGAYFITVSSEVAPQVGVALFFVAVVMGQLWGGLVVDRAGLAPGGKRAITRPRLLAVIVALAAVAIGATGSTGDPKLGLLALGVIAGVGVSIQQAGLGQLTRVSGDPVAAATVNFTVGTAGLVILALIFTGGSAPGGWSAPFIDWLGGILGATIAVTLSKLVSIFGVLAVILGLVAGQTFGGLVIDLIAPSQGHVVNAQSVISALLTVAAVAIAGMATGPRPRTAQA